MNIWFISKYASPPNYAKAPARLFSLAREAAKTGHKVTLITSSSNHFASFPETKKNYNFEIENGVVICWIKTFQYVKTASFKRIISWLDFERKLFSLRIKNEDVPQIVIISSLSILTILYGIYLKFKYKTFLIFEIRDIWPLTMTEEGGFSNWNLLVILIGWIEKLGYKKADLVVGTMPNLQAHVSKIIGYNKPCFCAPLGFNIENYAEKDILINHSFLSFIPNNKIIVGYAGSMGITNALEPFIETIKIMQSNLNVHFVLVGSGDLRNNYMNQLKGCSNSTFIERIDQKYVKDFLSKCDILYLSTKRSKVWDYGQSMNKVVEYMLAAKPIIATYSGYPSMINEANCGEFIKSLNPEDLRDCFLKFINLSSEERKIIGLKGRNWIIENRQYNKLWNEYFNAIIFELNKLK